MIILELFAGTRSFGKVAEKYGHKVYSVEIDPCFGCNMTMDIMDFDCIDFYKKYGCPDVIWASPDCTSFSLAGISHHRKNGVAFSETAKLGDKLLQKTIDIIDYYTDINIDLLYFIENPRALMRKQENLLQLLDNTMGKIDTVTYCQYGDTRMKPTDIFNNSHKFFPKRCKNGDTCHEPAPRGSKTGTQGLKGSKLRSIIPERLCEEIILSFTK